MERRVRKPDPRAAFIQVPLLLVAALGTVWLVFSSRRLNPIHVSLY